MKATHSNLRTTSMAPLLLRQLMKVLVTTLHIPANEASSAPPDARTMSELVL